MSYQMDPERKHRAEFVFSGYADRSPPPTYSNAFRPANDDHLLIQPKKLVNPVLESKSHSSMQRELKLNNKLGINVLNQKSELAKVFQERQRDQFHQTEMRNAPPKSELELEMERRRKLSEVDEGKEVEHAAVPEFVKMKEKLRKA